jgi:hypothetical protein
MKCNNLDCPARSEPETPCWEIAKRIGAYCDISNTCRDCIVCIIKKTTSVIYHKELQDFFKKKVLYERVGKDYPTCTLSTSING